eukprot:3050286-Heterocapsa_arctica.AAC.1
MTDSPSRRVVSRSPRRNAVPAAAPVTPQAPVDLTTILMGFKSEFLSRVEDIQNQVIESQQFQNEMIDT